MSRYIWSFNEMKKLAKKEKCRVVCLNMDSGEMAMTNDIRFIFYYIKNTTHWEYTCRNYRYDYKNKENKTVFLCYKIATASGHFYTVFFDIENGKVIEKGMKDLTKEYGDTFPELFDMTRIE